VPAQVAPVQLLDKNSVESQFTACSVGHSFALVGGMLELTTFQIFFMVLHGALLVFLVAFLSRGASHKKDNVVSLNDVKRRRRKKKRKKSVPKAAPTFTTPMSAEPAARDVRDVREVREIRELLEARNSNTAPDMVRYSLASGQRKSS
jgi:hypothetical protein